MMRHYRRVERDRERNKPMTRKHYNNKTYRELQTDLKHYRDVYGVKLQVKLNSKYAVLVDEMNRIAGYTFDRDDDDVTDEVREEVTNAADELLAMATQAHEQSLAREVDMLRQQLKEANTQLLRQGEELSQLRQQLKAYKENETATTVTDNDVLTVIDKLNDDDNYIPIYQVRAALPHISRQQLDQMLYNLEGEEYIELSTLAEPAGYTHEQLSGCIELLNCETLFYISRV